MLGPSSLHKVGELLVHGAEASILAGCSEILLFIFTAARQNLKIFKSPKQFNF